MDTAVKGGDYNIESLLKKMYGAAKAREHMKLYDDAMAGDQKSYIETQSNH